MKETELAGELPELEAIIPARALDELRRCAGEQFDPAIVDVFCDVRAQQRAEAQRSLTR